MPVRSRPACELLPGSRLLRRSSFQVARNRRGPLRLYGGDASALLFEPQSDRSTDLFADGNAVTFGDCLQSVEHSRIDAEGIELFILALRWHVTQCNTRKTARDQE